MEECCSCCNPRHKALKLIVLGIIILGNKLYLNIDWWLLFGGLLIFKGLIVFAMHGCCCKSGKEDKKKR